VAELVARHPGGAFVLDHLGKPPIAAGFASAGAWRRDLERLAAQPGLTAKLSGVVTEADWNGWTIEDVAPFVAHATDCFGADRLLHGSDWPVCTLAADYGRVVALHTSLVDESCHDAVFAANARRVYGLGAS
jgi:L-fuconolactonase